MGRSLTNELPKNAVLRLPPPSDDCSFYKSRRQEIGWLGGRLLPCKQNFWRRNVLITKTNLLRSTWSPRVTLWMCMASWTWETSRRWTTPRWRSPSRSRSGDLEKKNLTFQHRQAGCTGRTIVWGSTTRRWKRWPGTTTRGTSPSCPETLPPFPFLPTLWTSVMFSSRTLKTSRRSGSLTSSSTSPSR